MFIIQLLAFTTRYNTLLNPDWAVLFNLATKVQNIILNIASYVSNESNSTTEASKTYWAQKDDNLPVFPSYRIFSVPIKIVY